MSNRKKLLFGFLAGLAIVTLVMSIARPVGAQEVLPYSQAYAQAQATGKPLVIVVGMEGCPACVTQKTEWGYDPMALDGAIVSYVMRESPDGSSFEAIQKTYPTTYVHRFVGNRWTRVDAFTGYTPLGRVKNVIRRLLGR